MSIKSFRYSVSPLEALVLIHHVLQSEDAENDAERTVEEIVAEIDAFDGYLSKGVLESAIYCCNMEADREAFWHPYKWTFDHFVKELLPRGQLLDKYYGLIYEEKKDEKES